MAENEQPKPTRDLPGLSLDLFRTAVSALADLRDNGKYMVFLGRRSSVRFIGEVREFQERLTECLRREVSPAEADKALIEVRNFCQAVSGIGKVARVVSFLEENIFDDDFEDLDENGKAAFRELLKAKAELVSDRLYTRILKHRARRMRTATGPCVEDIDVEVVQERHEDLHGTTIEEPFLRIRLRYSEERSPDFPFFLLPLMPSPWGGPAFLPTQSFEFECDESDIDLLVLRLTAAKDLLMKSAKDAAGGQNE